MNNENNATQTNGAAYPEGFWASGMYAGIKKDTRAFDLGAIICQEPCASAAIFTTNRFCAPSVTYSRQIAKTGKLRGVLVNSGNANAGTGEQGIENVEIMAKAGERVFDLPSHSLAIAQTGIIGVQIDIYKIIDGIVKLKSLPNDSSAFSKTIITTDTTIKEYATEIKTSRGNYRIGGCAKGSGMIHPNMATMLAFITTDAKVSSSFLNKIIRPIADETFNMITVDKDTSTNDSLYLLANGKSGIEIKDGSKLAKQFEEAIATTFACLAQQIVRDGEGATKFITVNVYGAKTLGQARACARTIASSPLVKTAVHGADPNWGRIIAAAGYSGAEINTKDCCLYINDICLFERDIAFSQNLKMAASTLKEKDITINLYLNIGKHQATAWGCDLSAQYVAINSEYTT